MNTNLFKLYKITKNLSKNYSAFFCRICCRKIGFLILSALNFFGIRASRRSWIRMWRTNLSFLPKLFIHLVHLNGFKPVWVTTCRSSSRFLMKDFPQAGQANGRFPVCFAMWYFKLSGVENCREHKLHLYDLVCKSVDDLSRSLEKLSPIFWSLDVSSSVWN